MKSKKHFLVRSGTAPVRNKLKHSASAPYLATDSMVTGRSRAPLVRSSSFRSGRQVPTAPSSSSSSLGGMSPRIMEQISAVQANKIFVDDKITSDVSPPLSAPMRLRKTFWSEEDSLDGSTEDSDDFSNSKYTIPTLELAPRRARRRRATSPKAELGNRSRPPTRQQTAFPVDLDIASTLPEPRPLSRQEISIPAYSHKDTHTIRNLRELLSDSDKDHVDHLDGHNDFDRKRITDYAAPLSPLHKPSGHVNIPKSGFSRPKTRKKANALFLDLPSQTELEDRRVLSDRSCMESKHKNVWADKKRTSSYASPDTTPRSSSSNGSPPLARSPDSASPSLQPTFFSSAGCQTFVPLFAD